MPMLVNVLLAASVAAVVVWMLDAPDREERRAAERQAILEAVAALEGQGTSWTIQEDARHRLGRTVHTNHLFVHLYRLEKDGAITSAWGPGPKGQRRRLYRLASTASAS